jgi:signal transduction histidine kinase
VIRRVHLRTLLALVVLTTIVSFSVFAGWLMYRVQNQQQEIVDSQNVDLARAVSSAVDGEVQSSLNALHVLTTLDVLDERTLEPFRASALRLVRTQSNWHAVLLADAQGRGILDVADTHVGTGSGATMPWARTVIESRTSYYSNILQEQHPGYYFIIATPVIRDARVKYVLAAEIATTQLSSVLARQLAPVGGVLTLIDRDRRIMARTMNEAQTIGGAPASDFVAASRRMTQGSWRAVLLEGTPAYAALKTSDVTGWTVGLGMPFDLVEGPRRRGFLALSIVAVCLLIVGILSVLLLGRGGVPALERAGSAAALVARGERLPPLRSRIAEVAELFDGLRRADVTLRERRAERDEALDAEKMARREAERANRLKDEFLMAVSHELRTPLTAIRGWAHMLHTGEIAEGQRGRAVETIERNARLLAQLVDDLLDVSQGVAGKLRLNLRPTALDEVARAAVETIRPAAVAKGLTLTVETRGLNEVLGDPDRLQQVIWNVVANAVKFTPPGGAVAIAVAGTERAVDVIITDNGPGIDVEFLPYAFDPFRQGSAGRVRVDGGLGLGLAIVRQLTELHGGTVVVVNNTPEPGATFRLTFPGVSLPA